MKRLSAATALVAVVLAGGLLLRQAPRKFVLPPDESQSLRDDLNDAALPFNPHPSASAGPDDSSKGALLAPADPVDIAHEPDKSHRWYRNYAPGQRAESDAEKLEQDEDAWNKLIARADSSKDHSLSLSGGVMSFDQEGPSDGNQTLSAQKIISVGKQTLSVQKDESGRTTILMERLSADPQSKEEGESYVVTTKGELLEARSFTTTAGLLFSRRTYVQMKIDDKVRASYYNELDDWMNHSKEDIAAARAR